MAESLKLKTQTAQLSQSLKDGSFVKQASDIAKATAELAKHRIEQRKVWDEGRRQVMQSRFGNTLGGGLYAAQKYGGRAMTAAQQIGGSAVGLAGSMGATIGYGALVSRGFSGTSASAKLDNEFNMLSREIASSLLPEIELLTKGVRNIREARQRTRGGGGDLIDFAVGHTFEAAAATGLYSAARMAGFQPVTAIRGAASSLFSTAAGSVPADLAGGAAGGVGARGVAGAAGGKMLGRAGAAGAIAYGGYRIYEGLQPDTQGEAAYKNGLGSSGRAIDWLGRNSDFIPGVMPGVSSVLDQVAKYTLPNRSGSADSVAVTEQTGQKVGMTDAYEELQNATGRLAGSKSDGEGTLTETMKSVEASMKEMADGFRAILNKLW